VLIYLLLQKQGAELISINSETENQFVQNWFSINDDKPGQHNTWYTSGHVQPNSISTSPTFQWLDGTGFGSTQYDDTGNHHDQPGYFWVRGVGEIKRAYICEILKVHTTLISSETRSFSE